MNLANEILDFFDKNPREKMKLSVLGIAPVDHTRFIVDMVRGIVPASYISGVDTLRLGPDWLIVAEFEGVAVVVHNEAVREFLRERERAAYWLTL